MHKFNLKFSWVFAFHFWKRKL